MKNSLVFKAEYSHVPGVAVVKVLRTPSYLVQSGIPDESATKIVGTSEMWLKEVKNHSKLSQHAAIVSLYGANDRFLSLYMEYLDAPNLASYRLHLGYCTLGVDEAKRILADMSSAISYVHSQGIAHNDIKPANIMFNRIRGVVLIDFGLSSGLNDSTVHVGGSPWYIPPEYAINGKRGAPGDVFALGVVMLFVLGKVTLPDLQPRLNWMIADVRKGGARNAAWNTMFQWLGILEKAT
ncbi:kinase-like protein [Colletotrichum sublineola]|nr:kinase-like protein [Colletotrichum sublineola]